MAIIEYDQLEFRREKNHVKAFFLKNFYFTIEDDELDRIGSWKVRKNAVDFSSVSQRSAERKFRLIVQKGISELRSSINNHPTEYVHANSGIPLIGNSAFGIIDRNSTLIEVKPVTGCNLNCIYCSVDEGLSSRRRQDFLVEKDYIVDELKKLIMFKQAERIEVHIGTHGEPMLYSPLSQLVREISGISQVERVSMDTNGTMLTEKKLDELARAGLSQFNLSLNSLDPKIAAKMAGCAYDVEKVRDTAKHIAAREDTDLILTPILLPGVNEQEIPKLIRFARKIGAGKHCPAIGIQNFLNYRFGRNPVKQMPSANFFEKMREWERQHGIKLIFGEKDFHIRKTKKLPLPFRKGDVVEAEIICDGRIGNEKIAAADDRNITVICPDGTRGKVRVKLIRSKHNIFVGKCLKKKR
ncbi:radical SAM protein [Candidatus Woesearchaeota archaeon]|nr:radical SAM protein [Candidatus Woesearchaeota archaeon]